MKPRPPSFPLTFTDSDESEKQGERSPPKEDEGPANEELESNRVPFEYTSHHCDFSPCSSSCTGLAPPVLEADASDFDLSAQKTTSDDEEKTQKRKSYGTFKSKPLWKGVNNQSKRTIRTNEHGIVDWDDTLARPVFKRDEATAVAAALSEHSPLSPAQVSSSDLAEARATKKIRRVYKSHYRNLVQTHEGGTESPPATSSSPEKSRRGFDGSSSNAKLDSLFDFDQASPISCNVPKAKRQACAKLQSARTYFSNLDKTSLTVRVESVI